MKTTFPYHLNPAKVSAILAIAAGMLCLLGLIDWQMELSSLAGVGFLSLWMEPICILAGLFIAAAGWLHLAKPAYKKIAVCISGLAILMLSGQLGYQLFLFSGEGIRFAETTVTLLFLVSAFAGLLSFYDGQRLRLGELLALTLLFCSVTGLVGYLFEVEAISDPGEPAFVSVLSLCILTLLSISQLAGAEKGIAKEIIFKTANRRLLFRLLFAGFLPFLLLGWLVINLETFGKIDTGTLLTIMVTLFFMVAFVLLFVPARKTHSLEHAINGSNLGVWEWDLRKKTVRISAHWLRVLGYPGSREIFYVDEWVNYFHSDDLNDLKEKMDDYLSGRIPEYDVTHRMRHKDGHYLWVRDRGTVVRRDEKGAPIYMTGTYSNISMFQQQGELLVKTKEELRSLAIHLQDIREEERLYLSKLIHEELGQQLSSLKMELSGIGEKMHLADPESQETFHRSQQKLETTIQEVKRLSAELRPGIIDDLGLVASLQALVQEFRMRYNIRIRFSSLLDNMETSRKTALCIYRVLQEGLSNAARHSQAGSVAIRLTISEEGNLILAIRDNGIGFDLSDSNFKSRGLIEIRERMLMIDGTLQIHSEPGRGTCLWVSAPMSYES